METLLMVSLPGTRNGLEEEEEDWDMAVEDRGVSEEGAEERV